MSTEERIKSFSLLGLSLRSALEDAGVYASQLNTLIERQQYINPFFTPANVRYALNAIAAELTEENLSRWISPYNIPSGESSPVTAGLIFAGNIPLAGFHDLMSVLITGNRLKAKTSSKDPDLIPFLYEMLCSISTGFSGMAEFTAGILSGFDVVIATGSNNSSRYFEYYFGKYPHIIRKNRNSVAVLDGCESAREIKNLGRDVFTYFGLGCRNVSKLYVPAGYDVAMLTEHWEEYSATVNHSRYANNYDYNKAIYMVNRVPFTDGGFILFKEDTRLSSPVSVIYYEHYASAEKMKHQLELLKNEIQCVISSKDVPFGMSQSPHLWDYADGKDTLEFLLKKNTAGIL